MEEVLEVYHHPPDPENPVVAMDEQPVQLLKQTRPVIAAMPTCNGHAGHTERVDYEYERNGTASIFMFVAPFENWRRVSVREHRTKRDMAEELERLVMHDFASAKKVTIILDNLNTHEAGGSKFESSGLLPLAYWLNIAESELSVLTKQCLCGRLGSTRPNLIMRVIWSIFSHTEARGHGENQNPVTLCLVKTLF